MGSRKICVHYIFILIIFLSSTPVSSKSAQELELHVKHGWTSSPNYRGTSELLVVCLSAISLCCWTAYHPDLSQSRSTWIQICDRTLGFLVGITFPEIFLYTAFYENLDAQSAMVDLPERLVEHWTITHSFYANSGGFAIEYTVKGEPLGRPQRRVYLTAYTVRWLLVNNRIDLNTFPSQMQIEDKSKSDSLAKLFTIWQISWFLVASIGRLIQHLPLTTLEISTLAYIPCAMFAYFLWWKKPHEVVEPTILRLLPEETNVDAPGPQHGAPAAGHCKHWRQIGTREKLKGLEPSSRLFPGQNYRTWEITRQFGEIVRSSLVPVGVYGFSSAPVFFVVGGIHLAAWKFDFPSMSEQWAWRVCSLVIATIIPISWVINAVLLKVSTGSWWDGSECQDKLKQYRVMRWITISIQGVAIVLYALARLYLIVEVFVGLRATSAAVYKTPEWNNFLPHLG